MILDLFEGLSVTYWLDGGWGVDALYGRQTREHRDIDINFDATKTEDVLTALHDFGYVLDTDWLPVRAEFSHPKLGYLDIHPFVIEEDAGSAGRLGRMASLAGRLLADLRVVAIAEKINKAR